MCILGHLSSLNPAFVMPTLRKVLIQIIVVVLDTTSELRSVAMEVLCSLMTQLGQRYKIFIPMVKKVSGAPFRWPCHSSVYIVSVHISC